MKRVRIALWHNLPSGGGKRALMEHVKRLAKNADITLYTTTLVDDSFCPIEPFCTSVHRYEVLPHEDQGYARIRRRWQQGTQLYALAPQMAAEIDAGKYDAVYVAACQIEHAPSILRYLKSNTMYYAQEGLREYYEPRPALEGAKDVVGRILKRPDLIRRMLRDKRAIRSVKKVATNSVFSKNLLQKWYGIEAVVSYPGVDIELFYPRRPLVSHNERATFLSVGRLNRLKGHDFVIEVLGYLPKKYRNLTLAFDQDSESERARLQDLADARGVRLQFEYRISNEGLRALYQTAHAVVCGQLREPFGLIPIEAMACGALVCTVAEGGFLETVQHGKNGLRVERDSKKMAEMLISYLENSRKADALRASAITCVEEEWTWEVRVEHIRAFLLS